MSAGSKSGKAAKGADLRMFFGPAGGLPKAVPRLGSSQVRSLFPLTNTRPSVRNPDKSQFTEKDYELVRFLLLIVQLAYLTLFWQGGNKYVASSAAS